MIIAKAPVALVCRSSRWGIGATGVKVHLSDGETLYFGFRRSPLLGGAQWLTRHRIALEKVRGLYVGQRALGKYRQGQT